MECFQPANTEAGVWNYSKSPPPFRIICGLVDGVDAPTYRHRSVPQ